MPLIHLTRSRSIPMPLPSAICHLPFAICHDRPPFHYSAIGYLRLAILVGFQRAKKARKACAPGSPTACEKGPSVPQSCSPVVPRPCPVGTRENSPAFQRWVRGLCGISPEVMAGFCFLKRGNHALCVEITHKLLRSLAFYGHFVMAPLMLKNR